MYRLVIIWGRSMGIIIGERVHWYFIRKIISFIIKELIKVIINLFTEICLFYVWGREMERNIEIMKEDWR